jgi:hypothetical protein
MFRLCSLFAALIEMCRYHENGIFYYPQDGEYGDGHSKKTNRNDDEMNDTGGELHPIAFPEKGVMVCTNLCFSNTWLLFPHVTSLEYVAIIKCLCVGFNFSHVGHEELCITLPCFQLWSLQSTNLIYSSPFIQKQINQTMSGQDDEHHIDPDRSGSDDASSWVSVHSFVYQQLEHDPQYAVLWVGTNPAPPPLLQQLSSTLPKREGVAQLSMYRLQFKSFSSPIPTMPMKGEGLSSISNGSNGTVDDLQLVERKLTRSLTSKSFPSSSRLVRCMSVMDEEVDGLDDSEEIEERSHQIKRKKRTMDKLFPELPLPSPIFAGDTRERFAETKCSRDGMFIISKARI